MKKITPSTLMMLEIFAKARSDWFMPLAEARRYKQTVFRAVLVPKWIAFHRDLGEEGGFRITDAGKQAWTDYITTDILRSESQASRPLTAYFDAKAYGLRVIKAHRKTA